MTPVLSLSLFDPSTKSFLVPTKAASAAARRRGQGRPEGRRAGRASLDGGEHGRTLQGVGISVWRARPGCWLLLVLVLAVLVACSAAAPCLSAQTRPATTPITTIIDEAAARFRLPASWIHAVIRAESGGDPDAVSPKGAVGLMQLMPRTWRAMSTRHDLGQDPFDRRANVLAGAAYLRELFDQFGAEGFLAAYNAGPGRYADARAGRRRLPAETVVYVAKVERSIRTGQTALLAVDAPTVSDWRASGLFAGASNDSPTTGVSTFFVQPAGRGTP